MTEYAPTTLEWTSLTALYIHSLFSSPSRLFSRALAKILINTSVSD